MGRRPRLRLLKALLLLGLNPVSAFLQDQHCESLSPASNVSGLQCNASVDLIGTCWPQSPAGQLVVRPCPAYFYGVRYNTTNNGYRQCLANGSWAARVNYSECQEILSEEVRLWGGSHAATRAPRRGPACYLAGGQSGWGSQRLMASAGHSSSCSKEGVCVTWTGGRLMRGVLVPSFPPSTCSLAQVFIRFPPFPPE
uniref:Corticotropin releasing hormone receptor 1 n=1 Tax=Pipistrellus kuhlii TaxID=59472 RepID=A0A7J7U7N4_PIPKU|nr:corticotropin releasing hormone receptor 1 [Pipistrellus kuhlii]